MSLPEPPKRLVDAGELGAFERRGGGGPRAWTFFVAFLLGALLAGSAVALTFGKTPPVKPRADRVVAAVLEARGEGCGVQVISGAVPIAQRANLEHVAAVAERTLKTQGATLTRLVVTRSADGKLAIGALYAEACPTGIPPAPLAAARS